MRDNELHRFGFVERVVHWVVGLSFVLLLLTGLALSYPSLFWLTVLLGGGASSRVLHPWIGLVFTVGLVAMFFLWLKDMGFGRDDLRWFRAIGAYARHDNAGVPPAGKYNGGQKLFFWVQVVLGISFLLTGMVLWLPQGVGGVGPFGSRLISSMRLVHYLSALGGGLFLIVHIYLGTVAYPGTIRGILYGKVSRGWAKLHHPLWYQEKTRR